jgi:hypothetical protein
VLPLAAIPHAIIAAGEAPRQPPSLSPVVRERAEDRLPAGPARQV